MKSTVFFILLFLFISSCSGGSEKKKSEEMVINNSEESITQFPLPEIPIMLTSSEDRREFLLKHYWDNFDFSDSTLVYNRNVSEQGFADMLSLLNDNSISQELVKECIGNFSIRMEKYSYARSFFMDLADEYMYNPNSPYYNELFYLIFLKNMLGSSYVDEASKSSLSFRYNLLNRNMPGYKAENFIFYLRDGSNNSLYDMKINGDYILIFFYTPECEACKELIGLVHNDEMINKAISDGILTVLAVYTEGDEDLWHDSIDVIPEKWIAAHDNGFIIDNALYDLKAMPTIYLLDKNKKVILKDASYNLIVNYFADCLLKCK